MQQGLPQLNLIADFSGTKSSSWKSLVSATIREARSFVGSIPQDDDYLVDWSLKEED